MRLSEFITRNIEPILVQWEAFARTLMPAADGMSPMALRDDARQILEALVRDISTPETRDQQREKSLGHAEEHGAAADTPAQTHAQLRAGRGFDINQLIAEYRALRASVLRMWIDDCLPDAPHVDDMVRFNEAIDQAVTESVTHFNAQVEWARNLLLGMLGHDMRTPLQTILLTASYLASLNAGETVTNAAARLARSGARMRSLLDDLCDFNRTQLGLGIKIDPHDFDLSDIVNDMVEELRAAYPRRQIDLNVESNLSGRWDGQRIQQLVGNLVLNALKYGAQDKPVGVSVARANGGVCIEVSNHGPTLDQSTLARIFNPLQRGPGKSHNAPGDDSMGLGLFIAREIASAHDGTIEAKSDSSATVFVVRLPYRT
ncbi:sensor histidine kinase [Burkholderia seminalis]|uniref:sensor histidine kinase n=1 Tax=Burkholderia seminalis TaxID=488731 RepID=UPI001589CD56|nr:sensor histidine kinase [Burkholderia seminalis]